MKTQLQAAIHTMYKKLPYRDHTGENPYVGATTDAMLSVKLQDGPIGDVGINGIQLTELLDLVKEVYKELNAAFPCRENSLTITKIEEAIHWQDARTKDREARKVEGKNEA